MAHHVVDTRVYYRVFAALMALLVLTIVAAWIEHDTINAVIAITIAVTKAVLIVLFFMHVKYSAGTTKVFAAAGFGWLILLFLLTFGDYKTRSWPTNTGPAETAIEAEADQPREVMP